MKEGGEEEGEEPDEPSAAAVEAGWVAMMVGRLNIT